MQNPFFDQKLSFFVIFLPILALICILKFRFLKIPKKKLSHFVVYYRKHLELTFYIVLRPLESFFLVKNSLFPYFLATLAFFCIIKLMFLKIPKKKFSHFLACYKRHLELTFYNGFRPSESLF